MREHVMFSDHRKLCISSQRPCGVRADSRTELRNLGKSPTVRYSASVQYKLELPTPKKHDQEN